MRQCHRAERTLRTRYYTGTVGEYNASTRAAINANFITGLNYPGGLALAGNTLFVANLGGTTVGRIQRHDRSRD